MYKLWPWQAQFVTILSSNLQVWPLPSRYVNKISNGTSTLLREQLCQNIVKSMHKCRTYGPDMLNFWPFYNLTKCDLDHQPTQTNVSNDTTSPQEEHLCKIILKFMHKWRTYDPNKLNLWPVYRLTFKCDLDLQPTQSNVTWHYYSRRAPVLNYSEIRALR